MQTKGNVLVRWENGEEEIIVTIDLNALGPKVLIGMEKDEKFREKLISTEVTRVAIEWLGKAVDAE